MKQWISSWVETWRVAPPFSRRRRRLLSALKDPFPESYFEVCPACLYTSRVDFNRPVHTCEKGS